MIPRGLMIALCTGAIVAQAHAAAIPAPNDYIVFRDDPPKVTPDVIPNVAIKPFESIKVTEMRVRSEIALRYARTSVVTHVRNPDARPQEATFRMLLPDTAFISNFTMILGGTSYTAYVEKKEEAAQIYRQAVSQGIGAAHVATKARDSYEFMVSVNVEGNTTAVFDLRYEEFLVRRNGLYNHAINLHPGSFVPKMEVVVHIKESQKIMKLHVPELRTGNEVDATEHDKQNSKAVTRYGTSKREVTVTFAPDLPEQEELARIYERKSRENGSLDMFIGYSSDEAEQDEVESRSTLLGQFVVQYDVERTNNGEILVNDGYFVHFLAPSSLPPLSKYVVFVLDTSGSMYGRKIEQLRNAMAAILSDLNPNDYFNIIEFNSVIKIHDLNEADEIMSYTDYQTRSLVPPARATPENINRAKLIVSEFDVSGATDIYGALDVALNLTKHDVPLDEVTESANRSGVPSSNHENMTKAEVTSEKVECEPIIIFLTDGDANLGEMNNSRIISLITAQNSGGKRASIYSLAFGEDADRVFLRELSLRNEGFMRHIYEAADAALQLRDFYRQVSSPLLADVRFLYPRKQIREGSLSSINFRTLNAGAEAAVVGKIADNVTEITPQIRGLRGSEDGVRRELYEVSSRVAVSRNKDSYLPLERLWAYLTIKQLLDKRDAADDRGADENSAEKKALAIALKYGFVTPLTSLVVVKPTESKVKEEPEVEFLEQPQAESRVAGPPVMAPAAPGSEKRQSYVSATATARGNHTYRPRGIDNQVRYSPITYDVIYNTVTDFSNPRQPMVLITSTNTKRKSPQAQLSSGKDTPGRYYSGKSPQVQHHAGRETQHRTGVFQPKNNDGLGYPTTEPAEGEYSTTPTDRFEQYYLSISERRRDNTYHPKGSSVCGLNLNDLLALRWSQLTIEDFKWTSTLLNTTTNSLVLHDVDGNENVLELVNATTGVPPGLVDVDEECFPPTMPECEWTASAMQHMRGICVYITRCPVARHISADDYIKLYSCAVDNRYAGVCCPTWSRI